MISELTQLQSFENKGTTLASVLPQEHKFASCFGDPNHPVNSGSLIALVSGGRVNPKDWKKSQGRDRGSSPEKHFNSHDHPTHYSAEGGQYHDSRATDEYAPAQQDHLDNPVNRHASSSPPAPCGVTNPPAPYGEQYFNPPAPHSRQLRRERNHGGMRQDKSGPARKAAVKRILQPASTTET